MEEDPIGLVGLLATHRELVLDQFDHQLLDREACNGQRDAQAVLADFLDIVRRVAFGVLRQAIERALELVETQQQRRIEHRHATHNPPPKSEWPGTRYGLPLKENLGCRRGLSSGGEGRVFAVFRSRPVPPRRKPRQRAPGRVNSATLNARSPKGRVKKRSRRAMTLVASDMRRPREPRSNGLAAAGSRPLLSTVARALAAPATALGRPPRIGRWLLSSPLYSLTVGYGTPRSFFAVSPDPWPGDSARGRRMMTGEFAAHGLVGPIALDAGNPPWQRPDMPALWLDALNGFTWLRDLRDCGEAGAAHLAVRLIDDFTNCEWRWSPVTWRRDVLATRMVAWIRHYDWLAT